MNPASFEQPERESISGISIAIKVLGYFDGPVSPKVDYSHSISRNRLVLENVVKITQGPYHCSDRLIGHLRPVSIVKEAKTLLNGIPRSLIDHLEIEIVSQFCPTRYRIEYHRQYVGNRRYTCAVYPLNFPYQPLSLDRKKLKLD